MNYGIDREFSERATLRAFLSIILRYISRGRVMITLRHQNLGSIKL
jgi:hypothetical protein